jgi:hypothetical protein
MRTNNFRWAIAIMILVFSSPFISHGQHNAALKAHIFWTIYGLYTVAYEQAFNNHLTAELTLQGGSYIDVHPTRFEDYEVNGIGAVAALRYYPFTKKAVAPAGFFAYGALRYVDFNEEFLLTASNDHYKVGGNLVNAGLGVGYKFVYRRFGLEGFVGWGTGRLKSDDDEYRSTNIPEVHQSSIEQQKHFPQFDFALCYMISAFGKD